MFSPLAEPCPKKVFLTPRILTEVIRLVSGRFLRYLHVNDESFIQVNECKNDGPLLAEDEKFELTMRQITLWSGRILKYFELGENTFVRLYDGLDFIMCDLKHTGEQVINIVVKKWDFATNETSMYTEEEEEKDDVDLEMPPPVLFTCQPVEESKVEELNLNQQTVDNGATENTKF